MMAEMIYCIFVANFLFFESGLEGYLGFVFG